MAKLKLTGQPGNALPIDADASTNVIDVNYGLAMRMPIGEISTASTAAILQSTDAGILWTFGNWSSGASITLPQPEKGLWFRFLCVGAPTSAATNFKCPSTAGLFLVAGDSGGADAVTWKTTAGESGQYLEFIGISSVFYAGFQGVGLSTVAFSSVMLAGPAS